MAMDEGAKQQYQHILQTLKGVDFFTKFNMGELEELMQHIKKLACPKGHVIIKEGQSGDAFYMIYSGKVSIWKKKGFFGKTQLAFLGPDQFFGEMALATNAPRTATVIAEETCELFVLYSSDFRQILMKNPAIAREIDDILKQRQANTIIKLKEKK